MGDQPVTRAKLGELFTAVNALTTQMATLTTQVNNITLNLNNNRNNNNNNNGNDDNNINNRNNRGGGPTQVIRDRNNNNHTTDDSSSEDEEVMTEDGSERGNHHDYRVKADIPLFHGTMGVEEFLDWQIDVDRFFDVMDVPESKQVKMVAIVSLYFRQALMNWNEMMKSHLMYIIAF
ncbi:hypothetical protein QL285_056374 [Trifolium repens]|nr:hypothetical protein QL285_056374 [Trifolium repens]